MNREEYIEIRKKNLSNPMSLAWNLYKYKGGYLPEQIFTMMFFQYSGGQPWNVISDEVGRLDKEYGLTFMVDIEQQKVLKLW